MSTLGFLEGAEEYPRITRRLELGDYDPKLRGNYLEVWVNWSTDFNDRVREAEQEHNRALLAVGAEAREMAEKVRQVLERAGGVLSGPQGDVLRALVTRVDESQANLEASNRVVRENTAAFWGCSYDEVVAIFEVDQELWFWCCQQAIALKNEFRATRKNVARGGMPRSKARSKATRQH